MRRKYASFSGGLAPGKRLRSGAYRLTATPQGAASGAHNARFRIAERG